MFVEFMEIMTEKPKNSIPQKAPSQISVNPSSLVKTPQPNRARSHIDIADITSAARTICDILTRTSPLNIESALSSSGINPTADIVHEVLKSSYDYPSSAIKFFRWVGQILKHTPYAWNLMVDLLGKNQLFEPMWDAIRTMKQEGILSMATFVLVFENYCTAGRFSESVKSFDVMDRYGIKQDVVAVNSLLSAICRENNQASKALDFYKKIESKIPLDGDTFAILLEALEKGGNSEKAKAIFGEMVLRVGWSPENVPAYDAFLMTLVRQSQADEALTFLKDMKQHNCFPGLNFLANALDILIKQNDWINAIPLWDIMVGSGLMPDLIVYNAMIGLLCSNNKTDNAFHLLDEMPFNGIFPNSQTYNMIFECLIKTKNVRGTAKFFTEMIKNEFPPTDPNCAAAIKMLFNGDDPEAAHDIWNYKIDNHLEPLERSANALLLGLSDLERLTELRRSMEDMLDRRINISESTMMKIKDVFYRHGRSSRERFDSLSRKWRARVMV